MPFPRKQVPFQSATPCISGTIQAAIDSATHGDEIIVSATTFAEQINFGGKDIVLRSTDPTDPEVVANTIICATRYGIIGRPVIFSGSESEYTEALDIIKQGKQNLIDKPRADMEGHIPCPDDQMRQAWYQQRLIVEEQNRQALIDGVKKYDK